MTPRLSLFLSVFVLALAVALPLSAQAACGTSAADAIAQARAFHAAGAPGAERDALQCLIEAAGRLDAARSTTPADGSGAIHARVNNVGAATRIDWRSANTAYTAASCGAFTFANMHDGTTYNLFVEGTIPGTCSFTHDGLTFKLPPGHGATTANSMTVYSFTRAGAYVFVTWIPGY